MPTEVLSYYLKNKDRKVRLGFQVILQCAPFLKGLKVSGLISMENESYSELEEMFSGMEINFYKLSCSEGKCLVLFYRPKELEEYMNQPKLRELIGQYGYKESNIEEMLAHLSERICECTAQGIGFPHEIGAFLGYPTADVQSFIEKEGRDFIMTGLMAFTFSAAAGIQTADGGPSGISAPVPCRHVRRRRRPACRNRPAPDSAAPWHGCCPG